MFLLTRGEVEHLLCILEQNGAFGFRLSDIDSRRENGNFALEHLFHHT